MFDHIGQALLSDSIQSQGKVLGEGAEVGIGFKGHLEAASVHETVNVGIEGRFQAKFVKQRGMEQVRQITNVPGAFLRREEKVRDQTFRLEVSVGDQFILEEAKADDDGGEFLGGRIVEFAGDMPSFLVLNFEQLAGELSRGDFVHFALGKILVQDNQSNGNNAGEKGNDSADPTGWAGRMAGELQAELGALATDKILYSRNEGRGDRGVAAAGHTANGEIIGAFPGLGEATGGFFGKLAPGTIHRQYATLGIEEADVVCEGIENNGGELGIDRRAFGAAVLGGGRRRERRLARSVQTNRNYPRLSMSRATVFEGMAVDRMDNSESSESIGGERMAYGLQEIARGIRFLEELILASEA